MSARNVYFPGGFDPAAPNDNLAERWDLAAGTYTAWDRDGNQTDSRPLTDEETAQLQQVAAGQQAAGNMETLSGMLTQAIDDNHTYLALSAPTADDQTAQVRRLTRQVQGVIRYLGAAVERAGQQDLLDDISDVTTP